MLIGLVRRTETRVLLIWLGVAGAVWGFLNVANEMREGETADIDRRLLLLMREPGRPDDPIGPRTFEEPMRDVTGLGGFTILTLVTVVAVLAFAFHGKRRQAVILGATVLLAQATSEILKGVYHRPRPMLVPHGSYVYSASFPSGHSTLAAATFLTLATMVASLETHRSTKALAYAAAMLATVAVGISRVYLGVHWPSDVLAGWCAGAGFAFAAWTVLDWMGRRDLGAVRSDLNRDEAC
jgi:undecaprenyl-diphosphatase